MKFFLAAAALAFVSASPLISHANATDTIMPIGNYAEAIDGRTVAFLAHDLETGERIVLQGSDLESAHAPWSTFKIPNLLIALEEGFTPDLDTVRAWDSDARPAAFWWPDAWKQDQTLETAFQHSAVWYFQDIAQHVGASTYRELLNEWGYGNAGAPDGSDSFWLAGGLEISVEGQVAFLQRVVERDLPIETSSYEALDEASLVNTFDGYELHGKTGGGTVIPGNFSGPFEGWYSGYVTRDGQAPVVFTLYTQGPDWASIRSFRQTFATRLLVDASLLPAGFTN
ncbi:MAG: penicillin-binding transpeptidase domain-containing protein [Cohaesibacteraceae bacterium]